MIRLAAPVFKGMGIGFSHDLGGGAKLVAGFAQVPQTVVGNLGMAEIGQTFDGDDDGTLAKLLRPPTAWISLLTRTWPASGLSFSF